METVKIIVYGTLMTGERNHLLCKNAVSITPCTIIGTLYDTGYGFPAFVQEYYGKVEAELIEIPVEDWPAIDRLEGYPKLYNRKIITAKCADGREVEGWVYIMNEVPEGSGVIWNGSWKRRRG